jgi:hypothetical protein
MVGVEGMDKLLSDLRKVNLRIPNIESRFLNAIGESALNMLRMNTPVDTGNLRDSWQLQKSGKEIVIANDQQDLLSWIIFGARTHKMPRNFVQQVSDIIDMTVLDLLQEALAKNHRWFAKLTSAQRGTPPGIGGKGRKFQQVGRTSAGTKGGISFAGRSTLVRAGTGRRQLKRRLSLRRRRGGQMKTKTTKVG